jgi:hypothetical protein
MPSAWDPPLGIIETHLVFVLSLVFSLICSSCHAFVCFSLLCITCHVYMCLIMLLLHTCFMIFICYICMPWLNVFNHVYVIQINIYDAIIKLLIYLYVVIMMLLFFWIKMIWKLPKFLTVSSREMCGSLLHHCQ